MSNEYVNIKDFLSRKPYSIMVKSICCPYCGNTMIPQYVGGVLSTGGQQIRVLMQCVNPDCKKLFFANYDFALNEYNVNQELAVREQKFGDAINLISPAFVKIFNQAYKAEQVGLGEICGIGYRKALEYLIKDYLISLYPDKKEEFKKTALGNCINIINSNNVKELARRATWLGNDDTHYIRKWKDKDIHDLKNLIDLTCQYITMETKTKKYLEEMPVSNK